MQYNFSLGRTDLIPFPLYLGTFPARQDSLDKMLKDHDEVAVLSAVSCFMQRHLTRIHNYFRQNRK